MAALAPEAVNVEAAAKAAGVSRAYLYNVMKAGELPFVKLGDRRLIRTETLRKWQGTEGSRLKAKRARRPAARAL